MDGRSFVPLLRGQSGGWPEPRPIGLMLRKDCFKYDGVYAGTEVYVKWLAGGGACPTEEGELYNLAADPFQLENRLFEPTADALEDEDRLGFAEELATCAGIEGRDPQSGGRPFC